jgi:hypothetical protein
VRSSCSLRPPSRPNTPADIDILLRRLLKQFVVLLLSAVAGCAARAPHVAVVESQGDIPERTAKRLLGFWQQQLGQYIDREGHGDPAVLSQAVRSRDALRPARITFGVLDVESSAPGRDGWDIQGLLVGKQPNGTQNWYVFLVAIVARTGYRPYGIQDLRLVGLSAPGGKLVWQLGPANPQALQRYRDTFGASAPIRFPGDTDRFTMNVSEDGISVSEGESGARWSLAVSVQKPDARVEIEYGIAPRSLCRSVGSTPST